MLNKKNIVSIRDFVDMGENMKQIMLISAIVILTSCGLKTYTSGVMPMGGGIFSVSADDLNPSVAKKAAFSQAKSHCDEMGKDLLVIRTRDSSRNPREYYDITFKCLNSNDPELRNHSYESVPDVVIEDRRK